MTPRRHPLPPPTPEINLLCEILRGTPRLPGAACRDHRDLFDAARANGRGHSTRRLAAARAAAVRICHTCPALSECRSWLDTVPRTQRPSGVVAGQINRHPTRTLKTQPAERNS